MLTITHHDVDFVIDVCDWKNAETESQIASDALESGIRNLTIEQVQMVASAWIDADAECESRNADDDAAKIIGSIENAAYEKATQGWIREPDNGHNCSISIDNPTEIGRHGD